MSSVTDKAISGDLGPKEIIRMLDLQPHPEGGWYKQTFQDEPGPDGRSPQDVLAAVTREAREIVGEQYRLLNQVILPALADEGVVFPRREDWAPALRAWVHDTFTRELRPVA